MKNVFTVQGSLFNAPKGSVLAHACNCKGRWGAGIAAQFAQRFPAAYEVYQDFCRNEGSKLLGKCLLIPDRGYYIACLFTSRNYGQHVDTPEQILEATETAILSLVDQVGEDVVINMPKINSGLFQVPWRDTKKVLKKNPGLFRIWSID